MKKEDNSCIIPDSVITIGLTPEQIYILQNAKRLELKNGRIIAIYVEPKQ